MTKKTTSERVEEAVRTLVPESMELSFGCRLKAIRAYPFNDEYIVLKTHSDDIDIMRRGITGNHLMIELISKMDRYFEILGHPLTLEHCLMALLRAKKDSLWPHLTDRWTPLQPFEKQTEAIKFLAQYLL